MDCKAFLAWAMPRLGLEPAAFARVRRQVCKRVSRRLAELRLGSLEAYAAYLADHPEEWTHLDSLCHITISRFFRDRPVFDALVSSVLPRLAERARHAQPARPILRIWSAGCGAGEEPYSFALIWRHELLPRFPDLELEIIATDADAHQLERARAASYRPSSFRELPSAYPRTIDRDLQRHVTFLQQDLRREAPDGPFALVACRNLAFSYFDDAGQRRALELISERLVAEGVLVIGKRETLPTPNAFVPIGECLFEKRAPG